MLAREVWKEPRRATPLDNVIDVQMTRLRKKVDCGCGRTTDSHGSRRGLRPARRRAVKVPWSAASIRVRLTGWYAVVLSLMLVVYATATFVAVRQEFQEQLDDQLHDDFESAEGFLTPAPDGRVAWSGDRHHDPGRRRGPRQRRVVAERRSDRPLGRVGGLAAGRAGDRGCAGALRIDRRRRPALADADRHDAGGRTFRRLARGAIGRAPARAALGSAEGPRARSAAGDRAGRPRRIPARAPGAGADRSPGGSKPGG